MADIYAIPTTGSNLTSSFTTSRMRKDSLSRNGPFLSSLRDGKTAKGTWGRAANQHSWLNNFFSGTWVFLAPLTAMAAYITLYHFDGDLSSFLAATYNDGFLGVWSVFGPRFTYKGLVAWLAWLCLQVFLYLYLPGPTSEGQHTPAGHKLSYRTNGLLAWAVTHVLLGGLCGLGLLDPGFVPRNWGGLVWAMNLTGIAMSVFAYVKAYVYATHPDDRKFSGCALFDFYMGIEMNPRIGENFDLKLFNNGRPGIVGWTIIDLSNMAYQYQEFQRISPSLMFVTLFHGLYVLDFFLNESWYLRTIDIAHDHFGFYLAWGCFAWLPTMYTLQAQYLGQQDPSDSLSLLALVAISVPGILGYALFRSVNYQKDQARSTGGKCIIWGKPAEYISATYTTSDGARHETILLCSGWWGCARHVNYVGDLMLSTAVCAFAGTSKPLVWFYAVYMTVLLVHRCLRDEARGKAKYGATWDKYCERVPSRLIPGIW